jgi:multidrug efflux pump
MSRIFIERPIFAWVLAIIVMLGGLGALRSLPIEQYPDIAPTQVNVRASYPGASAETIENSVTQILEQQLVGLDGLLYFSSNSSARGQASVTATFAKGTDPDIAQVQVQNAIQSSISRLPQQVQAQGVRVSKSNASGLMMVNVYDSTNTRSNYDVSDYLTTNIQDVISRVEGVGEVNVFGSPHAMRIWLNPQKLAAMRLMPSDVIAAISAQNSEIAAGEVGGLPAPTGQLINANVTAQSRLQTVEEFEAIVLKTEQDGSTVRLKDVARVEIGAENYGGSGQMNGHPAAGMMIFPAPGADALKTIERVKEKVEELSKDFPDGLTFTYVNDSSDFIKLSVSEVVKALIEAIILVVIVMFVFLQSWRATLIPTIAVPVVLLGTFGVFYLMGFSINTLTLFGLVLAIGLLVDDAIVVVENVERLLAENPDMTPREATLQSMKELQNALIAIGLVLSAVFLPMAFFGGSTGVIYQQFAITIIAAMALSVLVALVLSPALTSTLLRNHHQHQDSKSPRFPALQQQMERAKNWFNTGFERTSNRYASSVAKVVDQKWRYLGLYGLLLVALIFLFFRLPSGFLPNEDQGTVAVQFRMPAGTTQERTIEVRDQIRDYFTKYESENIRTLFLTAGGGGGAAGQNSGQGFSNLVSWDQRKGEENSADAIAARANQALSAIRDAQIFVLVPGSIRGLGDTSGFSLQLQNRTGMSRQDFAAARDQLLAAANANPKLATVRLTDLPDVASLRINIDTQRLSAYGLTNADVNSTLSTAWGGRYVNDFIDEGRVKRVYVQGDAIYRSKPEDLAQWYVRAPAGQMAPFNSFSTIDWSTTPSSTSRFGGVPAYQISGQPSPGVSSGEAMAEMEKIAAEISGIGVAWSGASYEERLSSGQAPLLYALSLLVVFLCLAALYESWSIPFAVMLIIPLGLLGAVLAVSLRGLENDVYLQIGLLTTMGLAAKNAILMIEFAEQEERRGKGVLEAVMIAARLRLRPILMTSFAFIFGVLPLALASGAGANSRIAIGTSVIGGMLAATLLAIFFIPLFFVLVRRGVRNAITAIRGSGNQNPVQEPSA